MKKNLVRFAMIGFAAGFCMSAEAAPTISRAIAMSKCTKDTDDQGKNSDACSSKSGCNSCHSSSSYNPSGQSNSDESTAKAEIKSQRRSAAQKVLEGQ